MNRRILRDIDGDTLPKRSVKVKEKAWDCMFLQSLQHWYHDEEPRDGERGGKEP